MYWRFGLEFGIQTKNFKIFLFRVAYFVLCVRFIEQLMSLFDFLDVGGWINGKLVAT